MSPAPIQAGSRAGVLAGLLVLVSCASGEASEPVLPSVHEEIDVRVAGDGFVQAGSRRLALELFILELRQRLRTMDREQRMGLRINLDVDPDGGDAARDATERLMDELQIMGIWQVRYL